MSIHPLYELLVKDGVILNPDHNADQLVIRREIERFCMEISLSKGTPEDIPPMFFSAIEDNARRDLSDFNEFNVLVISVGGTNTFFRLIHFKNKKLSLSGELPGVISSIATPCNDYKPHELDELLHPIAEIALSWFAACPKNCKIGHILLNWGFPQLSYPLVNKKGITGAYGAGMTKGQKFVKDKGKQIEDVFRLCMADTASRNQLDNLLPLLRDVPISVQNDSVMSMFRYQERWRKEKYNQMVLMIIGTGTNLTISQSYVFEKGQVKQDSSGYAIRANISDKKSRNFWTNCETGSLKPLETLAKCDRRMPQDGDDIVLNMENLGMGGTGYTRIFYNLIQDYIADVNKLYERIDRFFDGLDAKKIETIARSKQSFLPQKIATAKVCEQLIILAQVVIYRNILKAAEVLAAISLYNGFGLTEGSKKDMLAMEGSIWKTSGFQAQVLELWNKIVQLELKTWGMARLSVDMITEDNFNASILGPAYLLGQYYK
jgi:hypothetical protein